MRRAERPRGEQAACRRQQPGDRVNRRWPRAPRRTSAAAGSRPPAAPSSSCRRRAARSAACCGRRPPRSPGRAARAPGRGRRRSRRRRPAVDGAGCCRRIARSATNASGSLSALTRPRSATRREQLDSPSTTAASPRLARGSSSAAIAIAPRRRGNRQHAARRLDAAVERELAERAATSATSRRLTTPEAARTPSAIGRSNDDPALRMSAGARLTVIAMRRELEAGVADGAPHAVAAFADAGVGQADHRERRAGRTRHPLRRGPCRLRCRTPPRCACTQACVARVQARGQTNGPEFRHLRVSMSETDRRNAARAIRC